MSWPHTVQGLATREPHAYFATSTGCCPIGSRAADGNPIDGIKRLGEDTRPGSSFRPGLCPASPRLANTRHAASIALNQGRTDGPCACVAVSPGLPVRSPEHRQQPRETGRVASGDGAPQRSGWRYRPPIWARMGVTIRRSWVCRTYSRACATARLCSIRRIGFPAWISVADLCDQPRRREFQHHRLQRKASWCLPTFNQRTPVQRLNGFQQTGTRHRCDKQRQQVIEASSVLAGSRATAAQIAPKRKAGSNCSARSVRTLPK